MGFQGGAWGEGGGSGGSGCVMGDNSRLYLPWPQAQQLHRQVFSIERQCTKSLSDSQESAYASRPADFPQQAPAVNQGTSIPLLSLSGCTSSQLLYMHSRPQYLLSACMQVVSSFAWSIICALRPNQMFGAMSLGASASIAVPSRVV